VSLAPPGARILGERLRTLREAASLTGAALAEQLGPGWRQSKIAKIEGGVRVPTVEEVTAWAAHLGADPEPLLSLREKAAILYHGWRDRIAGAGGAAEFQQEIAALEASCTTLGEYQPCFIPGLLQTPAYARQMIGPANAIAEDGHDLGRLVAAKVRRAGILHEGTRRIVHVIGEAALRTRIGAHTEATLRAQLTHLAELATLPGHEFGVIPFTALLPIEPASGFVCYDQDLVVVEHAGGDLQLADPDEVARYADWLEQLLGVALTGPDAAAFCLRIAAENPS
jgi:transcriptional regulator with XRE-family HTH domain